MKLTRHVAAVIIIYVLFSLVSLFIFGFLTIEMPENIYGSAVEYKFYSVLKLFFTFLPAILISAFLIGYSWAFGRNSQKRIERFSSVFIEFIKSIFVVGIVCIAVCVAAAEFFSPIAERKQKNMSEITENYTDYLELARYYTAQEEYSYAKFYIDNALALRPRAEEALSLSDEIGIYYSSIKKELPETEKAEYTGLIAGEDDVGYSVAVLVDEARKAFTSQEYFSAHYYASLALQMAPSDNGNIDAAKQLASDAWNMLGENPSGLDKKSVGIFEKKKEGYFALVNGDFEKAYYIFTDLRSNYPLDLDIQRYHSIAFEKMNTKYFFIDETENLQLFEQYRDIYFSNIRMDGGKDVIYIKGCTAIKKTGSFIQYLRDFSLFSFDSEGSLLYSFTVPYAKMSALPLEYTDSGFQEYMNSLGEKKIVPYILLESADRVSDGRFISPVFSNNDTGTAAHLNHYVLSLPYSDFVQICESSSGADVMPLMTLFQFAGKASLYGFSTEVYFQSLISRLTYPLILLIVFILTASLSWNYRLNSTLLFKFIWLFTLPFFTFIAYIILDTVLYLINLLYYVLFAFIGTLSLPVAVIVLIVFIFLSTVYFTALRAD